MTPQMWIVIPNWDEFQHYKDREPSWIKNYRNLLSKPEYINLSFPQRGLLHGIWLMYAESNRNVPVATTWLSRRLGGRVTKQMLVSLNDAGFIEFSASRPLAPRYHDASPEKEKEKDPLYPPKRKAEKQVEKQLRQMILNGAIRDEIDLAAELRARSLNGSLEHELKDLLADQARA